MKVGNRKTIVKTNEFIREVNEFADICRETTGASFTISKNKVGFWTVSLVNCGKQWISSDIMVAVKDAKKWMLENRKEMEKVETKYTLYDR